MGRYAYLSILVGNAARAGTAYGAQSLAQSVDATGIQTAATNDFQNNGPNSAVLTVSGGAPAEHTIRVDATAEGRSRRRFAAPESIPTQVSASLDTGW